MGWFVYILFQRKFMASPKQWQRIFIAEVRTVDVQWLGWKIHLETSTIQNTCLLSIKLSTKPTYQENILIIPLAVGRKLLTLLWQSHWFFWVVVNIPYPGSLLIYIGEYRCICHLNCSILYKKKPTTKNVKINRNIAGYKYLFECL